MFLKKFSSFTLFLGILSSITCQGVSGAGENCGGKSGYIYVEKEAEGEEESLVSRAKNKLKQAKDFISQNPVKAGAVGLAAAATPVLAYTGYKIKQHYFGEKDVAPAKDVQTDEENKGAEVNKEVPGSDKVSENKKLATNLPVNEENPPEGQGSGEETKSPVETEQSKPIGSNKEIDEKTEADSNKVNPAANTKDLYPSANANTADENENTSENLKSVYFGVYSEPIIYLLLRLTPQSWGLQDWWYNLWHYKNGRFSHPFKLIFAALLWIDFIMMVCVALYFSEEKEAKMSHVLRALMCCDPVLSRVLGVILAKSWKQKLSSFVFGAGNTVILSVLLGEEGSSGESSTK